jgi:hypothetical protein
MKALMMITSLTLLVAGLPGCDGPRSNDGATGAAPARYIGLRPNVSGTYTGATQSSSMLAQKMKEASARGATSGGANTPY